MLFREFGYYFRVTVKNDSELKHGTRTQTRITCKKISCYMFDSVCKWFIVENVKTFQSYANHF